VSGRASPLPRRFDSIRFPHRLASEDLTPLCLFLCTELQCPHPSWNERAADALLLFKWRVCVPVRATCTIHETELGSEYNTHLNVYADEVVSTGPVQSATPQCVEVTRDTAQGGQLRVHQASSVVGALRMSVS
jgi:hypothetical protein